MESAGRTIERVRTFHYKLLIEGAVVGLFAGLIVSLFRWSIDRLELFRGQILTEGKAGTALLLLLVCFLVTVLCLRLAPLCGGSGVPPIKGELQGRIQQPWARTLPAKVAGTLAAIAGGLSLGRAGPSVQMGALVGKGFGRIFKRNTTEEKLLMTGGAGAGLAAIFSAPLSGTIFALEGLHRNFSTEILLSTMAASISSDFVASRVFGLAPVFRLPAEQALPLTWHLALLPLAALLGLLGFLYNGSIAKLQDLYGKIPRQELRILIPFLLVIPLALRYPAVLGSGHDLVELAAAGTWLLPALLLLLFVKFLFSQISFTSGAPGGVFLPLLVLGALAGAAFGQAFGPGPEHLGSFVLCGMVGLFSAVLRTPVTGVVLITEVSGNFHNLLSLTLVALLSYVTAEILGSRPLYDQLLDRLLGGADLSLPPREAARQVISEYEVYPGSAMDGSTLAELSLPKGSLVVAVKRGDREVIPNGSTRLLDGDVLTILCRQGDLEQTEDHLRRMCHLPVNK